MKIANVGLIVCGALVFPAVAFAQSSDANYWKKLGTIARLYDVHTGPPSPREDPEPLPEVIAKCDSDPKGSIATLKKHLRANRIELPPR